LFIEKVWLGKGEENNENWNQGKRVMHIRQPRKKLLSAHGPTCTKPIRMNQSTGCPFQNKFREIKFRQVSRGENVHLKIYLMQMKCFTTQATLRTG